MIHSLSKVPAGRNFRAVLQLPGASSGGLRHWIESDRVFRSNLDRCWILEGSKWGEIDDPRLSCAVNPANDPSPGRLGFWPVGPSSQRRNVDRRSNQGPTRDVALLDVDVL